MTDGARRFVAPLSFEGVTGHPVHHELFATGSEGSGGAALHIHLGRDADLVCVAPATADFIARAAAGRSDDLLCVTLLATRAPVLVCPAMNDAMYGHAQVQANLERLRGLGYRLAGPGVGPLAAGEGDGPGRMLEPWEIVEHAGRALGEQDVFVGRTVLVTSGPTQEPLDAVRYVGNRSSGRMGHAVAAAAWRRGSHVVLVSGPTTLPDPVGVDVRRVETARQMLDAVALALPSADVVVFAAAVADYRARDIVADKLKRSTLGDGWTLDLVANPDVARDTRSARGVGAIVVGFALETSDLVANARRKLESKGFDIVVANDATADDSGFGVDTNRATLLTRDGNPEALPLISKDALAEEILDRVAALLHERG